MAFLSSSFQPVPLRFNRVSQRRPGAMGGTAPPIPARGNSQARTSASIIPSSLHPHPVTPSSITIASFLGMPPGGRTKYSLGTEDEG